MTGAYSEERTEETKRIGRGARGERGGGESTIDPGVELGHRWKQKQNKRGSHSSRLAHGALNRFGQPRPRPAQRASTHDGVCMDSGPSCLRSFVRRLRRASGRLVCCRGPDVCRGGCGGRRLEPRLPLPRTEPYLVLVHRRSGTQSLAQSKQQATSRLQARVPPVLHRHDTGSVWCVAHLDGSCIIYHISTRGGRQQGGPEDRTTAPDGQSPQDKCLASPSGAMPLTSPFFCQARTPWELHHRATVQLADLGIGTRYISLSPAQRNHISPSRMT